MLSKLQVILSALYKSMNFLKVEPMSHLTYASQSSEHHAFCIVDHPLLVGDRETIYLEENYNM